MTELATLKHVRSREESDMEWRGVYARTACLVAPGPIRRGENGRPG